MKITKTDFLALLEAPKHLWALKNNAITHENTDYEKHLIQQGYEVEKQAAKFIKQIAKNEIKEQPTFQEDVFEIRCDFLVKNNDAWDLYEVKSGTKIEKKHLYDVAFQKSILEKQLKINNTYIIHLNNKYTLKDELNLKELFLTINVDQKIAELENEIPLLKKQAKEILNAKEEELVGCDNPSTCPCPELCFPSLPEYSIYDINRFTQSKKKLAKLKQQGIFSIYDIPDDFPLSEIQKEQVLIAKNKQTIIDKAAIKEIFTNFEHPLYFIDYETFNAAIPKYKNYHPYDHIPFQWSLHILEKDGSINHHEFIATKDKDPIPDFIENLKKVLKNEGTIIVWHQPFEKNINKKMGEIHPQYQPFCDQMNQRIFDLKTIFSDNLYADPAFKGSSSIKKVLPIIVPHLSYQELAIGEGATAMIKWNEMVFKNSKDAQKIEQDLLTYCKLDTYAMVEIFLTLQKKVNL